jgi:RNAse (barnase) inhibitor barstar
VSFLTKQEDRRNLIVTLDGARITDVPSFWLSLGEAINGRHGYYGCNLDALDDCLCGGFGALPPLTIHLTHYEKVREALDCRAWIRFHAEGVREFLDDLDKYTADELDCIGILSRFGDGSEAEIARWRSIYTAALNDQPFECNGYWHYFDSLLEVFNRHCVTLLPADSP